MRPLEGITVLEIAQYLSGPLAGLRLADLGARVIKVERPDSGDPCRSLFISDPVDGENTLNAFIAYDQEGNRFGQDRADRNPDGRPEAKGSPYRCDPKL